MKSDTILGALGVAVVIECLLYLILFTGCSRTRDTLYNSHSVWTTNEVVVDGITNEVITQLTQYTVRPEVSAVVHTVGVFAPGWGTLGALGAGTALGIGGAYLNGKRKKKLVYETPKQERPNI